MLGFLGSEYKLRRLNNDEDIAYLFDQANDRLNDVKRVKHGVITQETIKLKERYKKYIKERSYTRKENPKADNRRMEELEAENAKLKAWVSDYDDEEDSIDYDDDIWEDGYHEVKIGDGRVLRKGEFVDGYLVDGVEYNIVIRVAKGDEENEEPVPFSELKDEKWHYEECGQYDGIFEFMIFKNSILEQGLQFFYIVDKKVQMIGKQIKPTLTNFRTLESFLEKEEPDELEFIKTEIRKYSETDYADIDI